MYDPNIGRFLSEDPNPDGTFADGPNNYTYVHNGPTNATDPTGLVTGKLSHMVQAATGTEYINPTRRNSWGFHARWVFDSDNDLPMVIQDVAVNGWLVVHDDHGYTHSVYWRENYKEAWVKGLGSQEIHVIGLSRMAKYLENRAPWHFRLDGRNLKLVADTGKDADCPRLVTSWRFHNVARFTAVNGRYNTVNTGGRGFLKSKNDFRITSVVWDNQPRDPIPVAPFTRALYPESGRSNLPDSPPDLTRGATVSDTDVWTAHWRIGMKWPDYTFETSLYDFMPSNDAR